MFISPKHTRRTKFPKDVLVTKAIDNPISIIRELHRRSFYHFFKFFWSTISSKQLIDNWHIKLICDELQKVQRNVSANKKKEYDLIINISPGTTKTTIVSIMFPVWCWTVDYKLKFITASYASALSLENAEASRDLIKSDLFKKIYPEIEMKKDKDAKSNYKVIFKNPRFKGRAPQILIGGNRLSTSPGGAGTGFHADIFIWDDLINCQDAISDTIIKSTNNWLDQTLLSRKTNKEVTVMVGIMQRLSENDPTGHLLSKKGAKIKQYCLPGELNEYEEEVKPKELKKYYKDGLFDPIRMNYNVLEDLKVELGQYGYAGQIGQKPTPPGGGMFQVDNISIIERLPAVTDIEKIVRYWDKAGTAGGGAFTAGVKIAKLKNGKFIIVDVKRGQWATHIRENIIKQTAVADDIAVSTQVKNTLHTDIWIEQEPGSGGKESAESTIKNLAGHSINAERPRGDKVYRADPFSVQVNYGNVMLLRADWNNEYINELRFFPFAKYKDQVDASSGAFSKLTEKRKVKSWIAV